MIGDDQRYAELPAILRLLDGGDAAVHRDNQPDALVRKLADGGAVQPVALLQTAGNMGNAVRAQRAQALHQ